MDKGGNAENSHETGNRYSVRGGMAIAARNSLPRDLCDALAGPGCVPAAHGERFLEERQRYFFRQNCRLDIFPDRASFNGVRRFRLFSGASLPLNLR
jgi:hypothetical protein